MPLLPFAVLTACSAPGGPYPSLQPRAAEAIDPRMPVVRPLNDRPVTSSLAAQLSVLVDQARSGNSAFDGAASEAERLAETAGGPQSEGWIAAQEALSAAIAARNTSSSVAFGRPYRMFSMIERWNSEMSCGTTEIASRRLCCVTREMSWPSMVTLPCWMS